MDRREVERTTFSVLFPGMPGGERGGTSLQICLSDLRSSTLSLRLQSQHVLGISLGGPVSVVSKTNLRQYDVTFQGFLKSARLGLSHSPNFFMNNREFVSDFQRGKLHLQSMTNEASSRIEDLKI